MKLSKLQETILYIISEAQENGLKPLSKFQLMKLIYLLQVESLKFTGSPFLDEPRFLRYQRGPLSPQIYDALSGLDGKYIKINEITNKEYGHNKQEHILVKLPKLNLSRSEQIFINSVLKDYLSLTQTKLGDVVYKTEPMAKIVEYEKQNHASMNGYQLDMSSIPLDEDVLEGMVTTP